MPAFLSKVFSRRKHDDGNKDGTAAARDREKDGAPASNKRASVHSVLEGAFAGKFSEAQQHDKDKDKEREKDKDKDKAAVKTVGRTRSKQKIRGEQTRDDVPHLTLNLSDPKADVSASAPLDVVFDAGSDGREPLDDAVLGARRLSPVEAVSLVRACSEVISAKGLETLGIMHPHWHSASPFLQRKLLSLFVLSLPPASPSSASAASSAFSSELTYARNPHDVSAVLRWGLRHLSLSGSSFGNPVPGPPDGFAWYDRFSKAERNQAYPPKAFSQLLVPTLPKEHVDLLRVTLDMISSLAARSEMNSVSGSKLSMFFGQYLLTGNKTDNINDWAAFYAQWERAGRILEHLFLAHLRDEAVDEKIPLRLVDLVKGYPYTKTNQPSSPPIVFPRPRFSTRTYDALYVRVTTELDTHSHDSKNKQPHPLKLIEDALKSYTSETVENHAYQAFWEEIKKVAVEYDDADDDAGKAGAGSRSGSLMLSRVFADETIRLLSLRPTNEEGKTTSPIITMFTPAPDRVANRRRSSSLGPHGGNGQANGKAIAGDAPTVSVHPKAASAAPVLGSPTSGSGAGTGGDGTSNSPIINDWGMFSTSGFGETPSASLAATLVDKEKALKEKGAAPVSRRGSGKPKKMPEHARSNSADGKSSPISGTAVGTGGAGGEGAVRKNTSTPVGVVQLDEAFVDFWSDALLDSVSSSWPAFVVCQLKSIPSLADKEIPNANAKGSQNQNKVGWVVIEQTFIAPPAPAEPATPMSAFTLMSPPSPGTGGGHGGGHGHRASSPKPSVRSDMTGERRPSRISSSFARKRFGLFGSSNSSSSTVDGKSGAGGAGAKAGAGTKVGEMGEVIYEEERGGRSSTSAAATVGGGVGRGRAAERQQQPQGQSTQAKKVDGEKTPPLLPALEEEKERSRADSILAAVTGVAGGGAAAAAAAVETTKKISEEKAASGAATPTAKDAAAVTQAQEQPEIAPAPPTASVAAEKEVALKEAEQQAGTAPFTEFNQTPAFDEVKAPGVPTKQDDMSVKMDADPVPVVPAAAADKRPGDLQTPEPVKAAGEQTVTNADQPAEVAPTDEKVLPEEPNDPPAAAKLSEPAAEKAPEHDVRTQDKVEPASEPEPEAVKADEPNGAPDVADAHSQGAAEPETEPTPLEKATTTTITEPEPIDRPDTPLSDAPATAPLTGAGDSRFVEHIYTPLDGSPLVPTAEPATRPATDGGQAAHAEVADAAAAAAPVDILPADDGSPSVAGEKTTEATAPEEPVEPTPMPAAAEPEPVVEPVPKPEEPSHEASGETQAVEDVQTVESGNTEVEPPSDAVNGDNHPSPSGGAEPDHGEGGKAD